MAQYFGATFNPAQPYVSLTMMYKYIYITICMWLDMYAVLES